MGKISLLYPQGKSDRTKMLSETTMHDLGLDELVSRVSKKDTERGLLFRNLQKMSVDEETANYRRDVFKDIYEHPDMCKEMMKLLDKVDFIREYGVHKNKFDEEAGVWDLMHRLAEIDDYIGYVEAMYECLDKSDIKSQGLRDLKNFLDTIYHDNGFMELKGDIAKLKDATSNLKSVTVGINLNDRYEAESIGLISVNSKPFTKSSIIGDFYDKITAKNSVRDDNEWDESYRYHPFTATQEQVVPALEKAMVIKAAVANPYMMKALGRIPDGDVTEDVTRYMDKLVNRMLVIVVKTLRETLNKHVTISVTDIASLIPEFLYYIRFAEFIKELESKGFKFAAGEAVIHEDGARTMEAKGIYNLKLTSDESMRYENVVTNDLIFDKDHMVYILTGANRGGKTTITQAVGALYVLAQGGIPVPGDEFIYTPVDCIFTHFPADEDKTLDLGRLGEECKRFKEIYRDATPDSLILLNETFSTTSFEEGYFIAKDSVKAILKKGIRTIYNTHMHKLAYEVDELNTSEAEGKAVSLVVKSDGGERSFKAVIAPPEGMSYAMDIAVKYGVTYEMLVGKED